MQPFCEHPVPLDDFLLRMEDEKESSRPKAMSKTYNQPEWNLEDWLINLLFFESPDRLYLALKIETLTNQKISKRNGG